MCVCVCEMCICEMCVCGVCDICICVVGVYVCICGMCDMCVCNLSVHMWYVCMCSVCVLCDMHVCVVCVSGMCVYVVCLLQYVCVLNVTYFKHFLICCCFSSLHIFYNQSTIEPNQQYSTFMKATFHSLFTKKNKVC